MRARSSQHIHATTTLPMEEAEAELREALAEEGFGILTEVDVPSVMQQKLGMEVEPYRILGACNPQIAYQAMQEWRGFGLVAPCHIALYDAGEHRVILAFDPASLPEVRDNADIYPLAKQAREAIERAVLSVGEPAEH